MKTCNDCIHYDVCHTITPISTESTGTCKLFKDKALVLDLPCAIDAEIYMLKDRYKGKKKIRTDIVKANIDCFTVGEARRPIADVCDVEGDFYTCLGAEDFYLNSEAAKQALKAKEHDENEY